MVRYQGIQYEMKYDGIILLRFRIILQIFKHFCFKMLRFALTKLFYVIKVQKKYIYNFHNAQNILIGFHSTHCFAFQGPQQLL